MQETYFLIRAGREYSYVVVKLEFCNSGPYCGCDCGCGPACGRVETHEAKVLGRYTTDAGRVCGVGAVDDEYPYPLYQAIPAIEIPQCSPCAILLVRGTDRKKRHRGRISIHGFCPLAHSPLRPWPWGQPDVLPRNAGNRSRLKEKQLIDRGKHLP